jgi:hypothetical protein
MRLDITGRPQTGIIRLTYQHTGCRNGPHCERDN